MADAEGVAEAHAFEHLCKEAGRSHLSEPHRTGVEEGEEVRVAALHDEVEALGRVHHVVKTHDVLVTQRAQAAQLLLRHGHVAAAILLLDDLHGHLVTRARVLGQAHLPARALAQGVRELVVREHNDRVARVADVLIAHVGQEGALLLHLRMPFCHAEIVRSLARSGHTCRGGRPPRRALDHTHVLRRVQAGSRPRPRSLGY
mmetsp:Transcript_28957/g.77882  ORF Transcript_28957/g.77882 Transcript_28957/m.77882 type:complete len:202 (+) Transcript_28957:1020-1625(+)